MKIKILKRTLYFLSFAGIALSALFLSSPVFASDIIINEILANPSSANDETEYIELYNKTDNDIDLTGWQLDDIENGGSKASSISGLIIPKKGFLVFYKNQTSIALNNDGDDVRLLNLNSNEIDKIHYDKTKTDVSIGRISDGADNIVELLSLSPGEPNGEPAPTPSPKPTTTPKPTATAKPTATPKLTSTPTTKPVTSPALKTSPSQSKTILAGSSSNTNLAEETSPGKYVLAANISSESPSIIISSKSGTPTPKKQVKVLASNQNNLSKLLISAGLILLIICGILAFRTYKKAKYE